MPQPCKPLGVRHCLGRDTVTQALPTIVVEKREPRAVPATGQRLLAHRERASTASRESFTRF
jgi:hypothetical protein